MTSFECIVLGCSGGPFENNCSGYLLSPFEHSTYVGLDAGSLLGGLEIAWKKGRVGRKSLQEIFRNELKGYLISHSHLDHLLGLVIASQADSPKPLYAQEATIDAIRDHLFNGKIWPNYGNEGENPIGQYSYHRLKVREKTLIEGTEMTFEMFPLVHARLCPSSAFLIEFRGDYVLYFGDTSADQTHETHALKTIWQKVAPFVHEGRLKGILLECSYPKGLSGAGVRAHLDTETMREELATLASIAGGIEGLKVVVIHRKESLQGSDPKELISKELAQNNSLGVHFVFPSQGDKILF